MNAGYASTIESVGGAVDQRRVGQLQLADRPRERRGSMRRRDARQRLLPARQVDAVRVDDEPLAVGQADDRDVEALRQQVRALLVQLPQQRAADVADADDRQRERVRCLEKRLVDRRSARGPAATRR